MPLAAKCTVAGSHKRSYSIPLDCKPSIKGPFIRPTPFLGPSSTKGAIRATSKRPLYKTHRGKFCEAQGNEAKLSPTSPPTQTNDKKQSLDALSDGMVSCDLPSWPLMLVRREYHTLRHHMPWGHIKQNG